jgi:hypothetical protein
VYVRDEGDLLAGKRCNKARSHIVRVDHIGANLGDNAAKLGFAQIRDRFKFYVSVSKCLADLSIGAAVDHFNAGGVFEHPDYLADDVFRARKSI